MSGIEEGATPLMYACQQGKEKECLDILAKMPGEAKEVDRTRKTPLHYCAESLHTGCAEAVLRAAPHVVNAKDEDGYSPLHLAVIAGNKPLIQTLLTRGADVNALDHEKHSVVHWATVCGEQEALDMVIRAGASISSPDMHGGYPLHYAAQMCGPGAELRGDPRAGLSVLRTLLACGANVDECDKDGRQPILWAASADAQSRDPGARFRSSGSAEAILALVKAGAKVEAADKDGLTALHCAASRGHTDCIETLVALCGCHVDTIDMNGCTALFYSATLGHADATQLLLNLGAEPNRQDRKGRTPAHCGAAKGQLETLRLLLAGGANLWLRNVKGDLPLHEAVASGRIELVRWLLNQRMDAVNVANNDGKCPIHVAAINNNVEMMKVLLDGGSLVNPVMRSNKGGMLTPLDAALIRGHRSCAKFLQVHGGVPKTKLTDSSAAIRGNTSSFGLERIGGRGMTIGPSAMGLSALPATPHLFGSPLTQKEYDADDIAIRHVERIDVPICRHERCDPVSSEDDMRLRRRRRRRKSERRRKESYDDEESNSDEEGSPESHSNKKSSKTKSKADNARKVKERGSCKKKSKKGKDLKENDKSQQSSPSHDNLVDPNRTGHQCENSNDAQNSSLFTMDGKSEIDSEIGYRLNKTEEEIDKAGDKKEELIKTIERVDEKNEVEKEVGLKRADVAKNQEAVTAMEENACDLQDSSFEEKDSNYNTKVEVEAEVHEERRRSFTVLPSDVEISESEMNSALFNKNNTANDSNNINRTDPPLFEKSLENSNVSLNAGSINVQQNLNDIVNIDNEAVQPKANCSIDNLDTAKNGYEENQNRNIIDCEDSLTFGSYSNSQVANGAFDPLRINEVVQTKRESTFLKEDSVLDSSMSAKGLTDEPVLPMRPGRRQSLVLGNSGNLDEGFQLERRKSDGGGVKSAHRGRRRSLFEKSEGEERYEKLPHSEDVETAIKTQLLTDPQLRTCSESGSSTRQDDSSALRDSGIEPSPRHDRLSPSSSPGGRIPRLCRRTHNVKPITPVSVTRAVQNTIRKYHLERKIFYQLLELKRLQIRAGRANEQVLVKRLVDEYQRAGHQAGLSQYTGTYSFRRFEKFLYEQLQTLQSGTQLVIPQLKPTDDIESLSAILKRTRAELQEGLPDNPALCTHSTHRCGHATHAYTGIPCAAYITKQNHHTMPKENARFLPEIDDTVKKNRGNRLSTRVGPNDKPVTLELIHGSEKQVISLPTERLDRTKRYYVTFTIKGGATPPQSDNLLSHQHAKTV